MSLQNLSDQELLQELERRKSATQNDRIAYKELVEETVPKALMTLISASESLTKAKTEVYRFFKDVMTLKEKAFDVKETQRSHTFSCEKGEITIGFRIIDGWDDTVNAGIDKVNAFISSLAKNEETSKLVNLVFSLLKKDAKGNLKSNRVLELQKLTSEFNNIEFTDGVDIISKAYKPVKSSWFIEASVLNNNGEKVTVPLNISSVDFEADFIFNYFNNNLNPSE